MVEIALGLIGAGLTTMAIVLGYIWRSNGRLQIVIMDGLKEILKEIQQGQERMQQGFQQMQQGFQQMQQQMQQGFQQMQQQMQQGFQQMQQGFQQMQKNFNTLSEMALKQTEILERIVKKVEK